MIYKIKILIIFLFSFFYSFKIFANKHGDYLYEINNWHGSLYKKKNVISMMGTGGSVPEKVEVFMLFYDVYCSLELEKARELIVHMTEDLIRKVNSDPKARLHMANYPINCKNVSITIGFSKKDCSYPESPFIGAVFGVTGHVRYKVYDPSIKKTVEYHSESYEEAKRIVLESECEN